MKTLDRFYIGGEWVAPSSDATMPIMNPASNTRIGTLSLGCERDVDRAVTAARRAFESYGFAPKSERLALLRRLRAVTVARMEEMAVAISTEMGAPITMARDVQADAGLGHLDAFIAALEGQAEEETLPNGDILSREPIGVCGLITPWNWPVNQIALKVIPALAVGACCVLKPSEHTPLSAQIYAEMVHEAGFAPGVFNMVQGDGPTVGAAMSRHPGIDMMSFTGSTRGGRAVQTDAAATIKRVTLELGGKSPNLVFADADLPTRVAEGVQGCFLNTGQSCDAPTRMLVERACLPQVLDLATAAAQAQAVGDPGREGGHIGPLFDEIQYHCVQKMIEAGLAEGARLLVGGPGKPEGWEKGWYARPTVFVDVTPDMRIWREEIFGPVLAIMPFDTEAEAIALANDTEYGLAAYIQTSDAGRAARVARVLRAGTIYINGQGASYGSPFGGFRQSGNGREGGLPGLEDYQELKLRTPFRA